MRSNKIINFLYGTVVGRIILKALVNPHVSQLAAVFLNCKLSIPMISRFIKKNGIDLSDYVVPENGYKSFNDFFTRRLKDEYIIDETDDIICPCDGLLTLTYIDDNTVFKIKGSEYSVTELLKSEELAKKYRNGTALIFRLTPLHYHRYVFCAPGNIIGSTSIKGILHSVQPICHYKTPVFIQNTREYIVLRNNKLGYIVQMEIGALLVGKINNHGGKLGSSIKAGKEKGYFEYGGSTIVLLYEDKIKIAEEISERPKLRTEIPVMLGEKLILI